MNTTCGNCDWFLPYDGHRTGKCKLHNKWVRSSTDKRRCFVNGAQTANGMLTPDRLWEKHVGEGRLPCGCCYNEKTGDITALCGEHRAGRVVLD